MAGSRSSVVTYTHPKYAYIHTVNFYRLEADGRHLQLFPLLLSRCASAVAGFTEERVWLRRAMCLFNGVHDSVNVSEGQKDRMGSVRRSTSRQSKPDYLWLDSLILKVIKKHARNIPKVTLSHFVEHVSTIYIYIYIYIYICTHTHISEHCVTVIQFLCHFETFGTNFVTLLTPNRGSLISGVFR
jgi:hypothetical protein